MVTGLVLAFVVAATVFYVSASGSAAAAYLVGQRCQDDTGLRLTTSDIDFGADDPADRQVRAVAARHGADRVVRTRVYWAQHLDAPDYAVLQLVSKDAAFDNVTVLRGAGQDGAGQDGVWIPDDFAAHFRLQPGSSVTVATKDGPVTIPVAAVYRRMSDPVPTFWCGERSLFVPRPLSSGEGLEEFPPPTVLVSPQLLDSLAAKGIRLRETRIDIGASQAPATSSDAQRHAAAASAMVPELRAVFADHFGEQVTVRNQTAVIADAARRTQQIVRDAVLPLTGVSLFAGLLGVLGLATQWVQRRASEVTLLWTRGVSPAAIGGKSVLEMGLPLLLGCGLGYLAAWLTVPALAPSAQTDPWAPAIAAALSAATWLLILAVLAVATSARVRRRFTSVRPERGRVAKWGRGLLRYFPWELAIGAAAVVVWTNLSGGAVVVADDSLPQVSVLALAFPLLCLVALVGMVARVAAWLAASSHRLRGWRSPTVLWALRRTAAQRKVAVALLGVAGLAVGVIAVGVGVATTERDSLRDKGWVRVGADNAVGLRARAGATTGVPESLRGEATRIAHAEVFIRDNKRGRVLLVDPDTFADGARWRPSWANSTLDALLQALRDAPSDGTVPVIVVGTHSVDRFVRTGLPPTRVVATVPSFPGIGQGEGMLVTTWQAVPPEARSSYNQEVLTRGDPARVVTALTEAGERTWIVVSAASSTNALAFLVVGWIFGFFVVLGVALALVAAVTLLVSVETRRRSTAVAHALLARMGLRSRSLLATHVVELAMLAGVSVLAGLAGGWAILRWSVPRLDPYPLLSPLPAPASLSTVGLVSFLVAAVGVIVVAGHAVRSARHAPVRELLRG